MTAIVLAVTEHYGGTGVSAGDDTPARDGGPFVNGPCDGMGVSS